MRLVIQRVKHAQVHVGTEVVGQINRGVLVFLGIAKDDTKKDADYLTTKLVGLRLFEDDQGKMNCSALDVGAEFLIVSQFTLYGDCTKGLRPSFDHAAHPEKAEELYEYFIEQMRSLYVKVETGLFRVMMDVSLVNDGPVTLIMDSKR